jgi:hypothetical protein
MKPEQQLKAIAPMFKSVMELFLPAFTKSVPETEAVREQANILAAFIYTSPAGQAFFKDFIDARGLAHIFYNLKQVDFDMLYLVTDRMRKIKPEVKHNDN